MNKYRFLLSLISALVLAFSNAALADVKPKDSISGYDKLSQMAQAMGGLKNILNLKTIEFNATGSRFEPEQAYKPGGEFIQIVDFQYTQIKSLVKQQSRTEWTNKDLFVFPGIKEYTEIVNGDHGAILGVALIGGPPQMPMSSTRLGAHIKQNVVSSPLALIHRAKQKSDQVKYLGNAEYNGRKQHVISISGWNQLIRVFIDSDSNLPTKVETLEDDTIYGDTIWEISFSDWIETNGIKVPTTLIHRINSRVINVEHRSSFNLTVTADPQLFAIPAELMIDFNLEQFAWGVRSSQWFNRFLPVGIPFDLDQRTSATLEIIEVAPKVFFATAPTHNSMIIEMADYLIVTEAPLYEERSQVVINAIKQRWPAKPVKYLVVTHFHNDHIGGIRAYGAIGATLIVGSQTKDHYEAIFKAPHTIHPDSYANLPVDVTIKEVESGDDFILNDGNRKVRILDVPNIHAIGSLVPFVEDVNLVFTSDLYSPGFFTTTIPEPFLSWSVNLLTALDASGLDIKQIVGGHGSYGSYDTFVSQVGSSL